MVLGIFSRVPTGSLRETWVRIEEHQLSFPQSGLKKTSVLKAEKIATIHNSVFQRKLGSLSKDTLKQVEEALKRALILS